MIVQNLNLRADIHVQNTELLLTNTFTMNEENQRRLLHDEEYYIRSNGIEPQYYQVNESIGQREERSRVEQEDYYQQKVLQKLVEEDTSAAKNEESSKKRKKVLESCKGITLSIKTVNEILEKVPLYALTKTCEVFYTLTSSGQWCSLSRGTSLEFSLEPFNTSAVREFLSLVEDSQKLQDLSSENIIEVCRIAHYLQCTILYNDIVAIIKESIDVDNCASICNLADQLNDPSLLICSMPFVTKRLKEIQKHDAWGDFSPSLQNHVITLRNAFESRIASKGQKSKALYTSSYEFLALLSDHLFEQRERLKEAVDRQNEIIAERRQRNKTRYVRHEDVMGGSVSDTAIKIEKQELHIQMLEIFYKEQKVIFTKDATAEGRYGRPFIL